MRLTSKSAHKRLNSGAEPLGIRVGLWIAPPDTGQNPIKKPLEWSTLGFYELRILSQPQLLDNIGSHRL